MAHPAEAVRYADAHESLVVRRLRTEEVTSAMAVRILEMLVSSYTEQLEDSAHMESPLPAGTVREHFDPFDPHKVADQQQRMKISMAREGQYWLATTDTDARDGVQSLGFLKVTPSKATVWQKLGLDDPHLYGASLVVDPHARKLYRANHVGAALAHTAVSHAGFDPEKVAALHAFKGSSVNEWFSRLGFREQDGTQESFVVGTHRIEQVLMSTERGEETVTLAGIRTALETRHPILASPTSGPIRLDSLPLL